MTINYDTKKRINGQNRQSWTHRLRVCKSSTASVLFLSRKVALIFAYSCICSKMVELMLQNCGAQWQVEGKQRAICRPRWVLHLLFLSTNQTMACSSWMGSRSNLTQTPLMYYIKLLQYSVRQNLIYLLNSCWLGNRGRCFYSVVAKPWCGLPPVTSLASMNGYVSVVLCAKWVLGVVKLPYCGGLVKRIIKMFYL